MTWQPIETAKDDGRMVLVWWPAFKEVNGHEAAMAWQKDGRWRFDGLVSYTIGPTHWMRIEPPEAI